MKKKIISILLTIVMLIGIIPLDAISAFAEEGVKYLEYNTETGAFDELTCTDYTPLADGVTTWSGGWYVAPASKLELGEVTVSGSASLILTDGCELIINGGLHVNAGSFFTVYGQSDGENMGILTASGGTHHAGIGGTNDSGCGNITICGGNITANGSSTGAGIGGGYGGSGGNITICGGNITANGEEGAGIGGGDYGSGGNITIYGGNITAKGVKWSAGIGGGHHGNGGNITIYDGSITTNGGERGAGIGGGDSGNGGNITIYGGSVTATGGERGAGIGGGDSGNGGNITLSGGTLKATGGYVDPILTRLGRTMGIGGGYCGGSATITLRDEVILIDKLFGKPVTVDASESWKYIFEKSSVFVEIFDINRKLPKCVGITSNTNAWTAGWYSVSGSVTINNSVTVTGDVHLILMGGCDLTVNGGIKVENENSLSIYSLPNGEKPGSLTANGCAENAGIGSGMETNGGNITICGGNITATGGERGAGIGGGSRSTGGNVTICGGSVTAKGGKEGAGIGGFNNGYLTVSGGRVSATGGAGAAGIGGHYNSHGINITVTGGCIIAKAGEQTVIPISGEIKKGNAIGHGGNNTENGMFLRSDGVTLYRPDGSVIPYGTMQGSSGYDYYIVGEVTKFGETDETIFIARSENDIISYLEFNTKNNKYEKKVISGIPPVFENNTVWSAPWYEVDGNVKIDNTIIVKGNVNLILKDGCKLEAKGGIAVNEGNSLTIYAQSNGDDMGELIAEGASVGLAGLGNAGIGGCLSEDGVEMNTLIAGDVTVHGGKITAIGTKGGAGIGGASGMKSSSPFGVNVITKCGNIIIYGGDITAEATDGGAGIGVGRAGESGSVSIYSKAKIHAVSNGAEGIKADAVTVYPNSTHDIVHIKQNDSDIEGSPFTQTTVIGSLLSQGNVDVIPETVHSFTGKYIDNGDGTHSQKCAYCDENGVAENHTFENHTCVCGATTDHDFKGDYVDNGDGTHSRKCTGCDALGEPENHTYKDGVCDKCGAGIITLKNGAVSENGFIFGLAPKLTSLTDYIDVAEGCELEYSTDKIGTGTEINAVKDSISYTSLTVVIFGDVNNDGVYDGMDAMIVNCLANGMLTKEQVGEAVYMAADCNHDGAIDSNDVDILNQAGVLLASVDQSKTQEELQTDSAYVEYLNLIDQNPVNEETQPEQTPSALDKLIGFIADIYAFLNNLINFIKTIFA